MLSTSRPLPSLVKFSLRGAGQRFRCRALVGNERFFFRKATVGWNLLDPNFFAISSREPLSDVADRHPEETSLLVSKAARKISSPGCLRCFTVQGSRSLRGSWSGFGRGSYGEEISFVYRLAPGLRLHYARASGLWISVLMYRRLLIACLKLFFSLGLSAPDLPDIASLLPFSREEAGEIAVLFAIAPSIASKVAAGPRPFCISVLCICQPVPVASVLVPRNAGDLAAPRLASLLAALFWLRWGPLKRAFSQWLLTSLSCL